MDDEDTQPEIKPETQPEIKPEKNLTKSDLVRNAIKSKIENGFEIKDKNSIKELNKSIVDELKISPNWRSHVRKLIGEYCENNKISLSAVGLQTKNIGGMTVNLQSPEPSTESTSASSSLPSSNNPVLPVSDYNNHILPKSETEEPAEEKQLSESAQKRLISKGLNGMLVPLYMSLGIVEPDEEEKEDEEKLPTAKQFKKDVDDFAGELNDYLIENDIKLPQFLSHISILISFGVLFVVPVVKFKLFNQKQKPKTNYDKSADNIEVKA